MLKLIGFTLLAITLNSRCASHDSVVGPTVPAPVADSVAVNSMDPAILEADVEGIGKATIMDRTILVKLPADYQKNTIRLTYKVTAGVKKITPASGQEIPVRTAQAPTVCIQNDALGNCTLAYQLVIQAVSPLKITFDPASRELDVTRYLQPYALAFQVGNLNAQAGLTRRFQIRFVHKTTGYTYVGDNYMVTDNTGMVVFVNQPNATLPEAGQLRMTGTLPLDMPTGTYAISVLVPTCYSPTADGRCLSLGTEGVDLTEPFALRAGPALVGETSPSPTAANELLIKGRNFLADKPLAIRFTSDFTQPVASSATIETETTARLSLPPALTTGQYRLDISPVGGMAYSALFTVPGTAVPGTAVPGEKAQPSFAYVAPLGSYVATQNPLPTLPSFSGGETLEVRYMSGSTQAVKAVRLVDTKDPAHTVALTDGGAFRPYAVATDFVMWKWTLPMGLPKGAYALVFETADGTLSLPYYQQIRIN